MRYKLPENLKKEFDAFVIWLQSNNKYQYAPMTVVDTERRTRRLSNFIDLTQVHEESYYSLYFYKEQAKGRGKQALNSDIKALNRYFLFKGWEIKIMEYSVRTDTLPKVPTTAEVKAILHARWQSPATTFRNRLILMYLFMGLRVSEVVSLNIEDVSEKGIHIRNTKAGASRMITMPSQLWKETQEYIQNYRVISDDKALLTGPKGRLTTQTIRKICKESGKQAGVPWFHPHAARHYAAVKLLEEDVRETYIQIYLGHADLRTTQRYLRGLRASQQIENVLAKINVLKEVLR